MREKKKKDKTLATALLKKVGHRISPLENTGEFCLLVLHYVPSAECMGKNRNSSKRISREETKKCLHRSFTLNEKQIFEQMENFYVASPAVQWCHSFINITQNSSLRFWPWDRLLKYTSASKRHTGKGEKEGTETGRERRRGEVR